MTIYMENLERCVRKELESGTLGTLTSAERRVVGATLDVVSCANPRLICPDDEGLIRATQGSAQAVLTAAAATNTVDLVLPALGLEYCLDLGLGTFTAVGAIINRRIEIIRSGVVVATYNEAMLVATTANSARAAMCPCNVCVGAIQPVTIRWTGTGAFAVGDVATLQLCRTFGNECQPRVKCGGC